MLLSSMTKMSGPAAPETRGSIESQVKNATRERGSPVDEVWCRESMIMASSNAVLNFVNTRDGRTASKKAYEAEGYRAMEIQIFGPNLRWVDR
nr:hypothetical protein CFP56_56951 [Quercus suber]